MADLGDTIMDWFNDIGQALIDLITAPFNAFSDIWDGWADAISSHGWYAPVLAVVVAIIVLVIFYFGTRIIDWFLN